MPLRNVTPENFGMNVVTVLALLALLDCLFNFFWTGNGIHGSEGALLVIVSTLLMALAAGLIARGLLRGWLGGLFEVLIVLDFLGTALAAYFLEAWILLALVVLAAVAWVFHLLRPAPRAPNFG
ncbi:MAG: hypothetical protein WDM84_05760 [Bauldia sp.]